MDSASLSLGDVGSAPCSDGQGIAVLAGCDISARGSIRVFGGMPVVGNTSADK